MTEDRETLRLLRSIDRRLALLTGPQERQLRARLTSDLLRTSARVAMFNAIDGHNSSPELGKAGGVTDRAAQLFVKELLDAGLVEPVDEDTGRSIIVNRNEDAIVRWYLAHSGSDEPKATK